MISAKQEAGADHENEVMLASLHAHTVRGTKSNSWSLKKFGG